MSGTSISFGSASTFTTDVSDTALAFDSNTGQIVIIFRNNANSNYGTGVVGTVSGTSISFGSLTVFESADSQYNAVAFDSSNNKAVVAYRDAGNAFYGTAVVGTISGTSISFGTPVVFESASTWYCAATYDSAAKKVAISYQDDGNAGAATLKVGTVSGTSITFNSPTLLTSEATNAISSGYDSNSEKVVVSFYDAIVEAGRSRVYQPAYTATNNTDFIGITDQAIADTATGAVNRLRFLCHTIFLALFMILLVLVLMHRKQTRRTLRLTLLAQRCLLLAQTEMMLMSTHYLQRLMLVRRCL
mgnify:CR=1 FL=1